MARTLYTLLWWIALPFLPLRLWWRGRREPGYRAHIGERFGRYRNDSSHRVADVVWIHAVSLGETRAAAPLIERIVRERPTATVLLTHMTATGRETGRALYADRAIQAWLPYDAPFAVRAFLNHFVPRVGVLIETEMWPNLAAECRRRGVPLFLVNARLSEQSAAGYARIASLSRPMLQSFAGVAAQTSSDAKRLIELGALDVKVIGNLKFDISVPEAARALGREFRTRVGEARPVWVAGSTREGEENLILDAIGGSFARALPANTLAIIVPRHPQRFESVAQLLRARGIAFVRRSENASVPPDTNVMLGDSIGEMFAYYAAADVAFVGGSLVPLGGQNLIEPIALGVPTLIGPHTFNFAEASAQAVDAAAALRVADANELIAQVAQLLSDPSARARMRTSAEAFCAAHRGAADRLWAWLAPRLPP
ncbi:MAG TPA: lipid IV(A) 3-deoxy-D-manno-octulosonic acid transferase [Casimicrobiaceae bacterium]|jgi:3-deoxy-D-manno-octulosonic-acid transferase